MYLQVLFSGIRMQHAIHGRGNYDYSVTIQSTIVKNAVKQTFMPGTNYSNTLIFISLTRIGSLMKKMGVLFPTRSQLPSSVYNLRAKPRGSLTVSALPLSPPEVETYKDEHTHTYSVHTCTVAPSNSGNNDSLCFNYSGRASRK